MWQNPSCFLYGPGEAKYEDRAVPEIKDPYDVIIRINYVGVCGSDVSHFIFVDYCYPSKKPAPFSSNPFRSYLYCLLDHSRIPLYTTIQRFAEH